MAGVRSRLLRIIVEEHARRGEVRSGSLGSLPGKRGSEIAAYGGIEQVEIYFAGQRRLGSRR
jgi:hypothetical protein